MWEVLITIAVAIFCAELVGYWLHVLLHSNKIEFLSKAHMIHHLVVYGPKQRFTTKEYKTALIDGRPGIAGIGLEWIIPISIIIILIILALWALSMPLHLSLTFVGVAAVWELIMFSYMHDALHLQKFWMIDHPFFKQWFQKTREKHVIHHLEIDNSGRMNKNYGICFFFFDKLFKTYEAHLGKFNEKGYEKAKHRYAYIYELIK